MDVDIQNAMDTIHGSDKAAQGAAFMTLIAATDAPVPWAYDIWDDLVADLTHKNNRVRAIASQLLCNLAKSDPKKRILRDFDALLHVTRDERFVTARHCMQNLWKVGVVGKKQQALLQEGLALRYDECAAEKNCTLIRYDIIVVLKTVYDTVGDDAVKAQALGLIETEGDLKYRKKYASVWK